MKRTNLVWIVVALLLFAAPNVTAQTGDQAWETWAARVRAEKPSMSEDDMKRMWEFRKNHPTFEVESLIQAWDFHKAHPEFGVDELGDIWEFHRAHPEVDVTNSLAEVWRYHKQNPQYSRDDVAKMWRLREQHGISRPHLADMWQYHERHPAQSERRFNRAYKKYQKNPEKFRNKHNMRQQHRRGSQ